MTAGKLDYYGLVEYAPRIIEVGGEVEQTSFCSIANVRYWNQPKRRCPDWQLKLPGLTLSDHIATHQARASTRLTSRIGWLTFWITALGVIVTIVAIVLTEAVS